jgi:hypothetical protein
MMRSSSARQSAKPAAMVVALSPSNWARWSQAVEVPLLHLRGSLEQLRLETIPTAIETSAPSADFDTIPR